MQFITEHPFLFYWLLGCPITALELVLYQTNIQKALQAIKEETLAGYDMTTYKLLVTLGLMIAPFLWPVTIARILFGF